MSRVRRLPIYWPARATRGNLSNAAAGFFAKSPGKGHAVIHDLVALPSLDSSESGSPDGAFSMERGILRRELSRFREFADSSINGFQATEVIWEYAKYYKLLDF